MDISKPRVISYSLKAKPVKGCGQGYLWQIFFFLLKREWQKKGKKGWGPLRAWSRGKKKEGSCVGGSIVNRAHTFHIPLRNQLILLYMKMKLLAGKSSPLEGKQTKFPIFSVSFLWVFWVFRRWAHHLSEVTTFATVAFKSKRYLSGPLRFLLTSYFFRNNPLLHFNIFT